MSTIGSISAGYLPAALVSGTAAIAVSTAQLGAEAQQIAAPGAPGVDAALLDSTQTLLLAQVAAQIIQNADQMLGTVIDTQA